VYTHRVQQAVLEIENSIANSNTRDRRVVFNALALLDTVNNARKQEER